LVYLRVVEFGLFGIGLWIAWRVLFRPLLRERRLTTDGMITIGFLICWFWDLLPNVQVWTFAYNSHFINMGGWAEFIPFWNAPNSAYLHEPILLLGGAYLGWFFMGPMIIGSKFINWLKGRFGLSTFGAFTVLWFLLLALEAVALFWMAISEFMQFPGVVKSMSLFSGKPYQYPLYDCVMGAFLFVGYAALHYFRDDKGRTFVEKGVDTLRLAPWGRKLLSQLAITGYIQVLLIFGYLVPYQLFAVRVDAYPQMKSYMNPNVCGPGTDYACPDRVTVPVPSKTSLHITPDDPRLPEHLRETG
jgi:hypothetical protein